MSTGNKAAYPAQFGEDGQTGFTKREVIASQMMASLVQKINFEALVQKINFEAYANEREALSIAADTALQATDILLAKLEQ